MSNSSGGTMTKYNEESRSNDQNGDVFKYTFIYGTPIGCAFWGVVAYVVFYILCK